jgi:biopolymer transport protein ExbD
MKLPVTRPRRNSEDNLIPLINIIFLLLIFFMLTGKLTSSDVFKIAPPASISEAAAAEEAVTVLVTADGQLAVNQQIVVIEELTAAVATLLKQHGPDPIVRLKADAGLPSARLLMVLNALRAAGVSKLTLLTALAR